MVKMRIVAREKTFMVVGRGLLCSETTELSMWEDLDNG